MVRVLLWGDLLLRVAPPLLQTLIQGWAVLRALRLSYQSGSLNSGLHQTR